MIKRSAVVLMAVILTGCGNKTLEEVGNAPAMSPVGSGLRYNQAPQLASYPKQTKAVSNGYSLWNDSQAALFKDSRAINVGDLLTVNISIADKAKFKNDTSRSRKNSTSLTWSTVINLFGITPPDSSGDLSTDSNSSSDGKGSVDRSETLTLMVAAVVTSILENGNLLISGSQEVRVNHEVRILNVAGIVRPQDVDAKNTISYEKIAEARISYGGKGRLTEVQQPPVGQQVVDMFSPF
ncbi:flagellar basal body L-ring protein FlgH [Agrobacterium vitis]|uniref:flagellar basal body L-ring protein FlgH n=1 Tax=Agrobacterium vitis TaxID=373 RepID=UPI001F260762|nr:flagellar basal body L-ring protein FlgH [Agrobacterium vitis]MCF1469101.1 flagellar basal body L-ring protein FlgH [Agrobacterium vitis]